MIDRDWYVVVSLHWHRLMVRAVSLEDARTRALDRLMSMKIPSAYQVQSVRLATAAEVTEHLASMRGLGKHVHA